MTHEEVQVLLATVPRARMNDAARRALEAHLSGCATCRQEAAFDRALEDGLRPVRAAGAAAPRVLERLRAARAAGNETRRVQPASRRGSRRRSSRPLVPAQRSAMPVWAMGAAAALLLVAVAFFALHGGSGGEGAKPSPLANNVPKPAPRETPRTPGVPEPLEPTESAGAPRVPQPAPAPAPEPARPAALAADSHDKDQWPLLLLPEPGPATADVQKEQGVRTGPGSGQARLRPIAARWSDHDTLRLADGAVGLDLPEADLRVLTLGSPKHKGTTDVLAVALGGLDPSRLVDLGSDAAASRGLDEVDELPVQAGRRYLLRLERAGRETFYQLAVAGYESGQYVDLAWNALSVAQVQELKAKAGAALDAARAKEAMRALEAQRNAKEPPAQILTRPEEQGDPPKKKSGKVVGGVKD